MINAITWKKLYTYYNNWPTELLPLAPAPTCGSTIPSWFTSFPVRKMLTWVLLITWMMNRSSWSKVLSTVGVLNTPTKSLLFWRTSSKRVANSSSTLTIYSVWDSLIYSSCSSPRFTKSAPLVTSKMMKKLAWRTVSLLFTVCSKTTSKARSSAVVFSKLSSN